VVAGGLCCIGVTPAGDFAYVTNQGAPTVWVIETASNTVVGTVTVGAAPVGMAFTPDGALAYVANQ
jgi:YVTN family beta-propeller protein